MSTFRIVTALTLALGLTACALPPDGTDHDSWKPGGQSEKGKDKGEELDAIIVRASGYAAFADDPDEASPQDALRVRRTSQLDAYRALAERVYGTTIYGNSTVNDFVLLNDQYQTYVDSYIRGAQIISVIEHDDGVKETVMQLQLEPRFRRCVADVMPEEARDQCPIPMPQGQDAPAQVISTGDRGQRETPDSLYFLE